MDASAINTITLHEGDVFNFQWNEGAWKRAKSILGGSDLNWCFEGQLICKPRHDSTLHLVDSYWGSSDGDNKTFTLERMQHDGTLTFLCNLADVEAINDYDHEYFKPGDVFCLRSQHGLRKRYVKRKDAARDAESMLELVRRKQLKLSRRIESETALALRLSAELSVLEYRIKHGDTSVSVPRVAHE